MKNENEHASGDGYGRKSYFGPILLITIGLVFLGKNLGIFPGDGWETIWRLWPLLLIVGGLDDLFRREGVAWPILMIGAGTVLLYNYFGPQAMISWTKIFQLWPVLLIAVGIDVLFRGQSGWRSLVGVLLSIVLIGAAVLLTFQGIDIQADYMKIDERYSSSVDGAELDLSLAVGEFIVGTETRSGKLIYGSVTPGTVVDDLDEMGRQISYHLESNKPAFFPYTARWDLHLTPDIPLELKVDLSVGEMLLDCTDLDLDSLYANQGVGRMVIDLPESIAHEVLIKQGVGVIEVEIPEGVRIAVDAQNGLTRVKFPGNFELEDGYYTTSGTSRTNAELMIVVEQGVGLVTFQYPE